MPEYVANGQVRRWTEAQALTRAAPTLESEGLSLNEVNGYRLFLDAANGQTLSGGGTLQAYYWCADTNSWIRNFDLDQPIPAGAAGQNKVVFADLVLSTPFGRVLYAANAVTTSGGTVTVRIVASTSFLRMR